MIDTIFAFILGLLYGEEPTEAMPTLLLDDRECRTNRHGTVTCE
jgi:hypothetical protein